MRPRSSEQWKRKHEALSAEHAALKRPLEELKAAHAAAQQEAAAAVAALGTLRQEHDAFKETSLRLAEAKDAEVARLVELNALMRTEPGPRRSGSFMDEGRLSTPFDLHIDGCAAAACFQPRIAAMAVGDILLLLNMKNGVSLQHGGCLRVRHHVDGMGGLEDGSVVDRRSVGPPASDLGDVEFDADGRSLRAAERQVRCCWATTCAETMCCCCVWRALYRRVLAACVARAGNKLYKHKHSFVTFLLCFDSRC